MKKILLVILSSLIILLPTSISNAAAYYSIIMTSPIESNYLAFSDENISILFSMGPKEIKQISFYLYNKTSEPIKIDWDQISFISPDGSILRTYHSGIHYIDAHGNKPMSPTIMPPKTKLSDFLGLCSGISYSGGWQEQFIFPSWYKEAEPYKNNSFSIFMPLEINGKLKYYTFTFLIKDIQKEWPVHAYLGINSFDKNTAVFNGSNFNNSGIYVANIVPNTPAEIAKIHVGDIITKINEFDINNESDLVNALSQFKPGDKAYLSLLRDEQKLDLFVTFAEKPEKP